MLSSLRQTSPVRLAVFLLFALTCYRLWFITQMELVPDEAYYWLWSKHLAWSYRDKGPAVAWTIALGTKLFGNTVFGIRFFAVMLSTGTCALLFLLARRLYDDRVALWTLLLAAVIPLVAVGSILMTIDSLSVFFWAWAALIFWKAIHRDNLTDWFWLGLAIGAGFLAKFTNGVQLGCIAFFLLWSKEHRPLLLSRKMLVLGGSFGVCILPVLWWNMQTGWVHAMALHARSGVDKSFHVHPWELLQFIGGQFGVISPLVAAGMVVAAGALLWKKPGDLRVRFLLGQFLPLYGLFAFFSLNKAGQAKLYLGLESGDDQTLADIHKGMTVAEQIEGCRLATEAGLELSVTAILGLAGKERSLEHGRATGVALSAIDPRYIGILTLMLTPGTAMERRVAGGALVLPDSIGMLRELREIVANTEVTHCTFRSNHASNYLPVGGELPREKAAMLVALDKVLQAPASVQLRPESWRLL